MPRALTLHSGVRLPSPPPPPSPSSSSSHWQWLPPLSALGSRQATRTARARYHTKLFLFYCLWALSPTYPPPESTVPPPAALAPGTCTASSPLDLVVVVVVEPPLGSTQPQLSPRGATPFLTDTEDDGEEAAPPPLTAPFALAPDSAASSSPVSAPSRDSPMPARGSTTRDVHTSSDWAPTPPLSDQPAVDSARPRLGEDSAPQSAQPAAGTDSPTCPSSSPSPPPPPPSPPPRAPLLTPLTYTLLALHLPLLLSLPLLNLSHSPALSALAPPPRGTAPPRRVAPSSLSKRLARARWRAQTIWTACGTELLLWACAALALCALSASASAGGTGARARARDAGGGAEGWNAVLRLGGWEGELRRVEGAAGSARGARGWRPLRNVVVLEVRWGRLCCASSVSRWRISWWSDCTR